MLITTNAKELISQQKLNQNVQIALGDILSQATRTENYINKYQLIEQLKSGSIKEPQSSIEIMALDSHLPNVRLHHMSTVLPVYGVERIYTALFDEMSRFIERYISDGQVDMYITYTDLEVTLHLCEPISDTDRQTLVDLMSSDSDIDMSLILELVDFLNGGLMIDIDDPCRIDMNVILPTNIRN